MTEDDNNTDTQLSEFPYADDSPASVYKELKQGERAIRNAANSLLEFVNDEVYKHDAYEAAKNHTLSGLFKEEAEGAKKRTELQRQAIYRLKHQQLRLEWQLAKRDTEAHKEYLEALLGIQTSIEARAKLISIDERFAGRNYGP